MQQCLLLKLHVLHLLLLEQPVLNFIDLVVGRAGVGWTFLVLELLLLELPVLQFLAEVCVCSAITVAVAVSAVFGRCSSCC